MTEMIQRHWYGDAAHPLLVPLAWLYGSVVALRRLAWRRGWLQPRRVAVPVLVVGNISVGGSGKTPLTMAVIEQARALNLKVGVISRGYGGRGGPYPLWVSPRTSPLQAGDEPVLMARRCRVPVVVDADRVRAAEYLLAEADVDWLIADDGLQHYRLARDGELAVEDVRRGYGNGWLLPAGPLREPQSRLQQVNRICVHGPGRDFWLEAGEARNLVTGQRCSLSRFAGQAVHAVAGIGEPARFFDMLVAAGLTIYRQPMADHQHYTVDMLDFGDQRSILMTDKDAVKCQPWAHEHCWAVPVETRLSPVCAADIKALLSGAGTRHKERK